jgi:SAM-dependent methyltransferase
MKGDLAKEYDEAFFTSGTRNSASFVVPVAYKLLQPKSVLDVGCGVGAWLAEWVNVGVTDVVGLDGEYVPASHLRIPPANFQPTDLRKPFSLGRRFDLVQSLEVAEHLDESCADAFVESLAAHADTVLFSAAIPGQGGRHHVNEQWPSYWAEKFSRLGLHPVDAIRPLIWTDQRISYWYRQNVLLFVREPIFEAHDTCIDLVHPELWGKVQARPFLRKMPTRVVYGRRPRLFFLR